MTDSILYNNQLGSIEAGNILVTPTGGSQGTLADLLAAPAGPVDATTLDASSTVTLSPANKDVTIAPSGTGKAVIGPATAGTMDNMVIGGTTPLAGHFTTLDATSTVGLSPANKDVTIAPTGTGKAVINPASLGTIDKMTIGATTPAAGTFTTITSATDGAITLTNQTDGASDKTATMTNGPIVGNPTVWVPMHVNGKDGWIPFWSA